VLNRFHAVALSLVLALAAFNAGPALAAFVGQALPIAKGGTGSTTKNFVDLTTAQASIAGIKTFTSKTKHIVTNDAALEFGQAAAYCYLSGGATPGAILSFGAYHNGTDYYNTRAIVNGVTVGSGTISFWGNSGLTLNSTFTPTQLMGITDVGVVIGTGSPTARLTLPAGTATANTAPLKLTTGTVLTTPEAGTLEFATPALSFTAVSTRERIFTGPALVASVQDPGSIAAGAVWESADIAVAGAQITEPVLVGAPSTIEAGLTWNAFVTSVGNVRLRLANNTASPVDPASATWNVTVQH
jgi:hypothetical protein